MGLVSRLFKRGAVKESRIAGALRAVVEADSTDNRRKLHEALIQQRLILPVPQGPDQLRRDERGRLQQDIRVDFISFQERDGRKFMVVFTHPEAMKKARKEWASATPKWIAVDTPSLCRLAIASLSSALKINPGSENSAELTLEEIQTLAKATVA
jgi:hypothetical protein